MLFCLVETLDLESIIVQQKASRHTNAFAEPSRRLSSKWCATKSAADKIQNTILVISLSIAGISTPSASEGTKKITIHGSNFVVGLWFVMWFCR